MQVAATTLVTHGTVLKKSVNNKSPSHFGFKMYYIQLKMSNKNYIWCVLCEKQEVQENKEPVGRQNK